MNYLLLSDIFPIHNVPIISEDMNAKIDKDGNDKFYLYNPPKRNGEYLAKNRLAMTEH